uniref:Uncharacterized protein n=1 Tax=Psilocybe cubensis TaxID=181762 RepID=A0A8H8CEZ8_PSICU
MSGKNVTDVTLGAVRIFTDAIAPDVRESDSEITIHQAFVTEDIQRRRRASELPALATAFQAAPAPSASKPKCAFCDMTNHAMDKCHKFIAAQKDAKERVKAARKGNRAHKASEAFSEEKESTKHSTGTDTFQTPHAKRGAA